MEGRSASIQSSAELRGGVRWRVRRCNEARRAKIWLGTLAHVEGSRGGKAGRIQARCTPFVGYGEEAVRNDGLSYICPIPDFRDTEQFSRLNRI